MNKDRIEGSLKQVRGTAKKAGGEVLGDPAMKAEGQVDKSEGTLQKMRGKLKELLGRG